MTGGWGIIVKEIMLSSTKQQVKIVTNDFISVAQHLLTNPQIKWEDYLWFNDDPLSVPPNNLNYVADINTAALRPKILAFNQKFGQADTDGCSNLHGCCYHGTIFKPTSDSCLVCFHNFQSQSLRTGLLLGNAWLCAQLLEGNLPRK